MAWSLLLPPHLKQQWHVKIRDKERNEPPHLTVMRGPQAWRIDLRSRAFLVPPGGSWSDLPVDLQHAIQNSWREACDQWDATYPHNPVRSRP